MLPECIEVNGIDKSHYLFILISFLFKIIFFEKFWYHALGIGVYPAVYVLYGLIVERSLVYLSIVVFLICLKEGIIYLERRLILEPDRISYHELFAFRIGKVADIPCHVVIDIVYWHGVADDFLHFLKSLAVRTVSSHSKSSWCREWRNKHVSLFLFALIKVLKHLYAELYLWICEFLVSFNALFSLDRYCIVETYTSYLWRQIEVLSSAKEIFAELAEVIFIELAALIDIRVSELIFCDIGSIAACDELSEKDEIIDIYTAVIVNVAVVMHTYRSYP